MHKRWLRLILTGVGTLFLSAHTLSPFTLTTLLQEENSRVWHQQVIQVRGFLYRTPSFLLVLAAQPNLKSCCIGTSSKLTHQIIVQGDLETAPLHQVVTLQGLFKIDPLYNAQNELKQFYVLEQATLISSTPFPFLTLSVVACLVIFSIAFLMKRVFEHLSK